jgi:argonaute-like protein implicated in RNA metabolism and viral defense
MPKTLTYKIPPKPTEWAGVNFKSLLEAQWARFFEAKGWGWEYEPFSVKTWLPDFIVNKNGFTALVEVKPTAEMFSLDKYQIALIRHQVVMLCTSKIQETNYLISKRNIKGINPDSFFDFDDNDIELFQHCKF